MRGCRRATCQAGSLQADGVPGSWGADPLRGRVSQVCRVWDSGPRETEVREGACWSSLAFPCPQGRATSWVRKPLRWEQPRPAPKVAAGTRQPEQGDAAWGSEGCFVLSHWDVFVSI